MEIQYQLTERDFREAMFAHRKVRPFQRWFYRGLIALVVVLLGFAALVLLGAAITHDLKPAMNIIPLIGLIVAWAGLIWLVPPWMAKTQFRKQPAVQSARSVKVDDAGLRSSWDGGSAESAWKNYIGIFESKNEILLYTSPACFNILPKRALTPEQLEEFRTLAKENISTKK